MNVKGGMKMKKKTLWIIIILIAIAIAAYFITTTMTGKILWGWSYCDEINPCPAGIGDCDSNSDCQTGYCAPDVGAKYERSARMDVCEVRPVA